MCCTVYGSQRPPSSEPRLHPQAASVWHAPLVWFGVKSCLFMRGFMRSQVFSVETPAKKTKCAALMTEGQPVTNTD